MIEVVLSRIKLSHCRLQLKAITTHSTVCSSAIRSLYVEYALVFWHVIGNVMGEGCDVLTPVFRCVDFSNN
jgi:hypothetical protein